MEVAKRNRNYLKFSINQNNPILSNNKVMKSLQSAQYAEEKLTTIVIASVVLSLFSSSSIELSDEKESVKLLDCTIRSNSTYNKQVR